MYTRTQFLVMFYSLEVLLLNNEDVVKEFATSADVAELDLWKARFFYMYDKQLTSNVAHL